MTVATASAYLGGHLATARKVGTRDAAFDRDGVGPAVSVPADRHGRDRLAAAHRLTAPARHRLTARRHREARWGTACGVLDRTVCRVGTAWSERTVRPGIPDLAAHLDGDLAADVTALAHAERLGRLLEWNTCATGTVSSPWSARSDSVCRSSALGRTQA